MTIATDSSTAAAASTPAPANSRRWVVLGVYALVVALSQLLWLNFAPLISMIQARYGVSELLASGLVLVFPALYVVFSLPAGALIDARGYRFTVGAGAALMAAAACVRIFDSSFWFLFAGQLGIAVAQPFIVNGISKLVTDWFSDDEGAIATGLGTMGMFLGMAAGMASTPALVSALSLRAAMAIFAAISIAVAIVFVAVVHPNPAHRAANAAAATTPSPSLMRNRALVMLFVLSFLGLGVFNGLTTWLEPILAPQGIDAERAGLVGGALIVAGIVGAVVIPALSDRARRRKPFLIACTVVALATIYPLCSSRSTAVVFTAAALHGFFFMPAFALLLEMCAQLAGPAAAGRATSILMMAGNAGGVAVIVAMPLVKGASPDFHRAAVLLVALLGLTTLLGLFGPETSRR